MEPNARSIYKLLNKFSMKDYEYDDNSKKSKLC